MDGKQLRDVLHLVGELADAPNAEEFSYRAGDALESLIAAQATSFNEWDYGTHQLTGFHDRSGFRPELAYLQELWPQCEWLLRLPPPDRVWQVELMSDRVPLKELKRREVYACVYQPIKIDHFLAITIGVRGQRRAVLLLDRDKSEFSNDERALAQLMTPPLARLYRSTCTRERLAARVKELEQALRELPRTSASPDGWSELTPRELEVLEHVAAGRTDREIATLLYLSVRTIQKHLQHAYEKLGVRTRTAAAMLVFGDRGESTKLAAQRSTADYG